MTTRTPSSTLELLYSELLRRTLPAVIDRQPTRSHTCSIGAQVTIPAFDGAKPFPLTEVTLQRFVNCVFRSILSAVRSAALSIRGRTRCIFFRAELYPKATRPNTASNRERATSTQIHLLIQGCVAVQPARTTDSDPRLRIRTKGDQARGGGGRWIRFHKARCRAHLALSRPRRQRPNGRSMQTLLGKGPRTGRRDRAPALA